MYWCTWKIGFVKSMNSIIIITFLAVKSDSCFPTSDSLLLYSSIICIVIAAFVFYLFKTLFVKFLERFSASSTSPYLTMSLIIFCVSSLCCYRLALLYSLAIRSNRMSLTIRVSFPDLVCQLFCASMSSRSWPYWAYDTFCVWQIVWRLYVAISLTGEFGSYWPIWRITSANG